MRLIRCHIENFGKLHDYTVEFEQRCSVFCEKNGWGKSTLAAFIRVMFYGFQGENKRKGIGNERKRFRPWQGGSYGGHLTFETENGRYTVTRIFSEKKQNDVFELRDADTNLVSRDFSQNLGEELFQINSESFQRTVFIGQNDCITRSTDSINAKIGNLTDNMNDLDCYEKADGALQDLLNKMNPQRKTGTIYQMNDRITQMQTAVSNGASIEESMERYEALMLHENERLQQKRKEQEEIYALQKQVGLFKEAKAKQAAYEQLCRDFERKAHTMQETSEKFPGVMPEETELQEYLDACSDMEQAGQAAEIYRLTEQEEEQFLALDRRFHGGISDSGNGGKEDDISEVSELIGLWNERNTRKSVYSVKEAALQTLKETGRAEQRNMDGRNPIRLLLGIAAAIAGAVLCTKTVIPGMILIAVGAGLLIADVMNRKKTSADLHPQDHYAPKKKEQGHSIPKKKEQDHSALDNMERELREDEAFILKTEQKTASYLTTHGQTYDESDAGDKLQRILAKLMVQEQDRQNNVQRYAALKEKNLNYQTSCDKYEWNRKFILTGIKKMGLKPQEDLKEQLQTIWRNSIICRNAKREYDAAKSEKLAFELQNDMEKILAAASAAELPGLEELNQHQIQLDEETESIRNQLRIYQTQLDTLRDNYDEWTEIKERLSEAKKEAASQKLKYGHIRKTQEYLAKAKEALTARYMDPVMNSFVRYYQIVMENRMLHEKAQNAADRMECAGITESRTERAENQAGIIENRIERAEDQTDIAAGSYHIDANTNITVKEQGLQRETEYLSTGYQDLIGLCLRLSLADAMYQGEKPFLVLDDPFVNLDDDKMNGAKRLLEYISKEYQVIYFTCTNMRR